MIQHRMEVIAIPCVHTFETAVLLTLIVPIGSLLSSCIVIQTHDVLCAWLLSQEVLGNTRKRAGKIILKSLRRRVHGKKQQAQAAALFCLMILFRKFIRAWCVLTKYF